MELSIEPDRILISSDGYLSELHQLLKQKPGEITDLSNWKQYRSDKLISLALFDPKKVKSGLSPMSGLPMMMAQNLIKKNESLDSIFASVGLQLLPPAGLFDLTLNSHNLSWLEQTQTDVLNQIEDMKSKSTGLTYLQLLLGKINIQKKVQEDLRENSDGDIGQLSMTIELDSEFKKSVELSIRELMEKFFSIGLSENTSGAGIALQKVEEKLDSAPFKYWPQYKESKLKSFNEDLDQFFKPAWIEGPFAVSIDELLLASEQDGDQIVLQLRAKGQNIDNVGSEQVKIRVTGVYDQQENNLLDEVKCGQNKSQNEAFFSRWGGMRTAYVDNKKVNYTELEVRHPIKLKKEVNFSQVKSLKGLIELNLATATQSKEFAKTDKNKIVNEYDTRILFKPSEQDTLSYTISGDGRKILAVRALNKNKDYLSRMSRSSMGNLFNSGQSVTQKFYGKIAFIEVIYVTQFQQIDYPFTIAKFPPYPSDTQWKYELEFAKISSIKLWNKSYQDLEAISFDNEKNWNGEMQASWHNGPLNLALYGLKTNKHWGTTGQLMI
jgi:hypothetical protein